MKNKKLRFITVFFVLTIFISGFSPLNISYAENAKTEMTIDEKIIALGISQEKLNRMDIAYKQLVVKVYDDSDGKAKLLKQEKINDIGTRSLQDLDIEGCFGYITKTDSKYKYANITFLGDINAHPRDSGVAVAFSDGWTIMDSESVTVYQTLTGDYVYEWGYLVDATPKVGVAYAYDSYPFYTGRAYWSLDVDLRIPKTSSGTTDIVGKIANSVENVVMGATFAASPSVTFTPNNKVEQIAYYTHFDY